MRKPKKQIRDERVQGSALAGRIVEATIREDGVREIQNFKLYSWSLVSLEHAPPYCRIYEIDGRPVPLPSNYRQRADGTYEKLERKRKTR